MDRRRWQILRLLAHGPSTVSGLAEALAPFLGDGESVAAPVDRLGEAGLTLRTMLRMIGNLEKH